MVSLLDPSPQTHPLFSVSHPPSISSSFSNNIPLSLSTESDKQSSHTVSSSSSQKEIHSGRWSKTENILFLSGVVQFGNNWKKIQENIKTRTTTQARSHAQKIFIKIKNKHIIDISSNINTIQELFEFIKKNENFDDIYKSIVLIANEDTKGARAKKEYQKREKTNKKKSKRLSVNWNVDLKNVNYQEMKISFDVDSGVKKTSSFGKEKFKESRKQSVKNEFTKVKEMLKDYNLYDDLEEDKLEIYKNK